MKTKNLIIISVYFTVLTFLVKTELFSQNPGDIDESFGNNGISLVNYADCENIATSMGLQSDNKIIIGGKYKYETTGLNMLWAYRMLQNGTIDSYGNYSTHFGYHLDNYSIINALHVLSDDKTICAGYYGYGIFLLKVTENGFPDLSFGTDGVVLTDLLYYANDIVEINEAGSGYFLIAGYTEDDYPGIIKVNMNGNIVTTFGDYGLAKYSATGGEFHDIAFDDNSSSIFVCGSLDNDQAIVASFDYNGIPQSGFDDDGFLTIDAPNYGSQLSATAICYNEQDFLTVFGSYFHPDLDFDICAFRLNQDGSLNQSFGVNGWSYLRISGSYEYIRCALRQSDGKYYYAGGTDYYFDYDFMIGRMLNNGFTDNSFGENGFVTTGINDERDGIDAMCLLEDEGRLIVTGNSTNYSDYYAAVTAKYYTGFYTGIVKNTRPSSLITVVPNPVKSIAKITFHDISNQHAILSVKNIAGIEVLKMNANIENGSLQFNMTEFPEGIYFIQVLTDDLQNYSGKIVIRK